MDNNDDATITTNAMETVALLQGWMVGVPNHLQVVQNPKVHQILSTQVGGN